MAAVIHTNAFVLAREADDNQDVAYCGDVEPAITPRRYLCTRPVDHDPPHAVLADPRIAGQFPVIRAVWWDQ
jgi:hypothetical protein